VKISSPFKRKVSFAQNGRITDMKCLEHEAFGVVNENPYANIMFTNRVEIMQSHRAIAT